MIPNWTPELASAVRDLCATIKLDNSDDPVACGERSVVIATGALPVYGDFGGWLVITPSGLIQHFDEVLGDVDERWKRLALVMAAERYSQLRELRPVRPAGAATCGYCHGDGRIHNCPCGNCSATGWLAQ